jgi:polysaccharide biosynthesis/export protein
MLSHSSKRKGDFPVIINRSAFFLLALILMCTPAVHSAASSYAESAGRNQKYFTAEAAAHQNASPSVPTNSAATREYVIGAEDVLAVNVWKEPDISRTLPVRPDGKISLPLVGELQASGLTAAQLQDIIAQKLKEYIGNPQVNVIVQEVKSRSFNIVGKVLKPGAFDLAKPTSVLDAIALAGGFQDFAKVSKIYVLRRMPDGSQRMLPFNYKLVIKGKRLDENVGLQSGDTVVVP